MTPVVLASVVIDDTEPVPVLPPKTGRKIWRDKDKKAERKKNPRPKKSGKSPRYSISVSGETFRKFKEATSARGLKMGPELEKEVDRFFGIYRIEE